MARTWSERSRGQYLGLYPYYTLGALSDRNFVVAADFSDAARSIFGGSGTTSPSSPAAAPGSLPNTSTGEGVLAAAVGAVSVAGVVTGAVRATQGPRRTVSD